jgi:hypothetical protein
MPQKLKLVADVGSYMSNPNPKILLNIDWLNERLIVVFV